MKFCALGCMLISPPTHPPTYHPRKRQKKMSTQEGEPLLKQSRIHGAINVDYGTTPVPPGASSSGLHQRHGRPPMGSSPSTSIVQSGIDTAAKYLKPGLSQAGRKDTKSVLPDAASARPIRRRRGVGARLTEVDQRSGIGTVRAVSTCAEFNLDVIAAHYQSRGLTVVRKEAIVWITLMVPSYKFDSNPGAEGDAQDESPQDDDSFEREYTIADSDNEDDGTYQVRPGGEYEYNIFFHSYGVVVWWSQFPPSTDMKLAGLPLLEEVKRMKDTFEIDSLDKVELDTCRWTVVPEPEEEVVTRRKVKEKGPSSYIDQDCFYLTERNTELMLAYGCGLAQSAKVSEFEDKIEDVVEETKEYPIAMAKTGKSDLTRTEVAKIRGSLFLHRMYVNLHTDVLETPELFWTRTDLEPYYLQARRYMEISHRTDVLNQRLEIVHDLFAAFHEELNTNHSNFLEWIIIWLIVAELVLGAASAMLSIE